MNNIYIEKTPETCEECSCCYYDDYAECYKCPLLLDNEINIYDKDSDCPLKLITDRLAEERKRVVQEIKDKISDGLYQNSYGETFIDGDIYKILDQIERGE